MNQRGLLADNLISQVIVCLTLLDDESGEEVPIEHFSFSPNFSISAIQQDQEVNISEVEQQLRSMLLRLLMMDPPSKIPTLDPSHSSLSFCILSLVRKEEEEEEEMVDGPLTNHLTSGEWVSSPHLFPLHQSSSDVDLPSIYPISSLSSPFFEISLTLFSFNHQTSNNNKKSTKLPSSSRPND